jgi:hypothetical protein
MKNINRWANHITKNGINVMVHSIYGTTNWIIAQKIAPNKWIISLGNPMGNITYNLGECTEEQHLQLWYDLTQMEIEKKTTQALLAKEMKESIKKFIKTYKEYKNFKKINKKRKKKNKK